MIRHLLFEVKHWMFGLHFHYVKEGVWQFRWVLTAHAKWHATQSGTYSVTEMEPDQRC